MNHAENNGHVSGVFLSFLFISYSLLSSLRFLLFFTHTISNAFPHFHAFLYASNPSFHVFSQAHISRHTFIHTHAHTHNLVILQKYYLIIFTST